MRRQLEEQPDFIRVRLGATTDIKNVGFYGDVARGELEPEEKVNRVRFRDVRDEKRREFEWLFREANDAREITPHPPSP